MNRTYHAGFLPLKIFGIYTASLLFSIVFFFINVLFLKVEILLSGVLSLWCFHFIIALLDIRNSITEVCFLVSFFVFLLGRQVCYAYLDINRVYGFLDVTNNFTYLCLLTSLIALFIGRSIGSTGTCRSIIIEKKHKLIDLQGSIFRNAFKLFFIFCYAIQMVVVVLQIRYVKQVGYLASYTSDAGGAGVPSFLFYFSGFTSIALCLYLATKPAKKETLFLFVLYEIYAVVSIFTGQRYPFFGMNMFMLSYMIIRSRTDRSWFKRRYFILILLFVPVALFFASTYDAVRVGKEATFEGLSSVLVRFLDSQGGSINTIRRTIFNAEELEDLKFVSLNNTRIAIFENGIARRIFNVKVYAGNSLEKAMYGHGLADRLSYIAYGDGYLNGLGTGSSYIAELLHDFGLLGVFVGSLLYGVWLKKINLIKFENRIGNGIGLAMLYYLYLAPRGSFDAFVGNIFRIYSVGLFILILLAINIINNRWKKVVYCSDKEEVF